MIKTSHFVKKPLQHNPIHVDSQWFKNIIKLTGSMEEAILLMDTIIYYHNRYKPFKIGNESLYGLAYSAKKYQKILHISYYKARRLPNKLVEKGLLKAHSKKLMCNRTFYTPTKQALDNVYQIHFSATKSDDEMCNSLVQFRKTACSISQNPYKDKNKDNNNLLKNYNLLRQSKSGDMETVVFDFKKFKIEDIRCEASILDYFTVKQNEAINIIVYYYKETIDIIKFNQVLNKTSLKEKAKDFRQLVSWAYLEAVNNNNHIKTNKILENKNLLINGQGKQKISSDIQLLKVHNPIVNAKNLSSTSQNHIQKNIHKKIKQSKPRKTYVSMTISANHQRNKRTPKIEEISNNKLIYKVPSSSYLLTSSNQFFLIKNLSVKEVEDENEIVKKTQEVINEYYDFSSNQFLNNMVYRLIKLPKLKKQTVINNRKSPMLLENKVNYSFDNYTEKKEIISNLLNKTNKKLLFDGLNTVGINDKKLIFHTAQKVITDYPDLNFSELLQGVIYLLVTLPKKQQKKDEIDLSLLIGLSNIDDGKPLEYIAFNSKENHPELGKVNNSALPKIYDIMMPYADKYLLRKDLASQADQKFYNGKIPNSQQLALLAIIDYVKRKGVTITTDQEVYEWLYHMVSNQKYYYSKAHNFKHWCNIVIRQLMKRALHKPFGFDRWRSRVLDNNFTFSV